MIASASTPRGQRAVDAAARPPSRAAQNASATAGGEWRTSSAPCSPTARSSTRRSCLELAVVQALLGTGALAPGEQRLHARPCARHVLVEPGVAAGGQFALGQERGQPVGLLDDRPQHVQRGHVARALPDRVQRRIAVQQRHPRLLDEPVAAQALERLGGMRRGPLGHPVLHDRGGKAPERSLSGLVVAAGDAHRGDGGGL